MDRNVTAVPMGLNLGSRQVLGSSDSDDYAMSAQLQGKRVAAALGLVRLPGDGDNRVARLFPSHSDRKKVARGHRRSYTHFLSPSIALLNYILIARKFSKSL